MARDVTDEVRFGHSSAAEPRSSGASRWQLTLTTVLIMAFGVYLPFSPLARPLGFVALPVLYWPILVATLLSYVGLTQLIKMWLIRKAWV